eukprot:9438032-Alexandrium_andersonii.AAC.1
MPEDDVVALDLVLSDTTGSVKSTIDDREGIPPEEKSLTFAGHQHADSLVTLEVVKPDDKL